MLRMYLRGGAFDSQPSTGDGAATVAGSNEAVGTTKNMVVPTNEDVENLSDEDETKGTTENGEKTWGDFANTSWYTEADANATEYHITTAEQLAGLAKLINEQDNSVMFKGKTVYLDNDLDLAGYEWISIGNGLRQDNATKVDPEGYYSFCGTFDGQGHVISNLYSHDSLLDNDDNYIPDSNLATPHGRDVYKTGLFGSVYKGTIKNLGVENADIWIDPNDVSTYGEGILVDFLEDSTVENCWTTGSITGGMYFEKWIGGVIGITLGNCKISECYSKATITGNYDGSGYTVPGGAKPMDNFDSLGGILGGVPFGGSLDISDCWFDGEVAVTSIQAAVGGIVGYADEVNVKNCLVATTDIEKDPVEETNTCWVGYLWGGTVANNYWYTDEKYEATPLGEEVNKAAGTAVSDFKSADVLEGLQKNEGTGIEWVAGIKHPTFAWDERNISADYTKVDEAIAAAEAIDGSRYTNYDAVEAAVKAVDRTKSKAEQGKVDAMAEAITKAIAALVEKSNNSSSSGGGGSSTPRYAVTVPDKTENGSLSVTPQNAKRGSSVTITATPDKGCEVDDIVAKDAKGNKLTLKDNGDGTYTFTMPASKVTIEATFAEKQAEPIVPEKFFADVSAEEYYYEAVKWASENGVTGGIGENLFGAKLPCTRAQIVTFLWRAAGSPEPKGMSGFVDVSADAYYAKAVAWAVEQGIVSGTSATTFSPDAVCTRAQSVAFLYRAFGTRTDKAAGFSDVSADAYYADAVAWAVENGVASGIGGGLFAPDQDCARGQIVAFLYRAYQNK